MSGLASPVEPSQAQGVTMVARHLRGTNSKDIWGLRHLVGRGRGRVRSVNKLLFRMHGRMRPCERKGVPCVYGMRVMV